MKRMRDFMDKLVWIVSVFAMVTLFLSCGNSEEAAMEKAIEAGASQDGQDVDVDIDGENMTVTSADGTTRIEGDKATVVTADGTTVIDGDSMQMTSQDGAVTMSTGENAVIPADFPKDVPVYPGAQILAVMSDTSTDARMLQMKSTDDLEKVAAHFREQVPAQGWKMDTEIKTPGDPPMQILGFRKNGRVLMLTLSGGTEGTEISLTLESDEGGAPAPEEPPVAETDAPAPEAETAEPPAEDAPATQ